MTEVPSGWHEENGKIVRSFAPHQVREEFADGGGDLMTKAVFGDFELEFEFNIEDGGNSGVMYRVTEDESRSYWTGPEFQILERADRKSDPAFHFSGANYALQGPESDVSLGSGKWNVGKIVMDDGRVEHWLNGKLVVSYELESEDWKKRVRESKFLNRPAYGVQPVGHIVLQDHGHEVAFRNVKIRPLDDRMTIQKDFSNSEWWSLFNGKNFDHWRTWLGIPHRSVEGLDLEQDSDGNYVEAIGFNDDPKGVYSIVELDGEPVLRISGEIYGALTTQQAFDNFHLKLEYKWGDAKWPPREDQKRNGGVLYYATGDIRGPFPEQSFMRSLECQMHEGDAGDLILLFAPQVEIPVVSQTVADGKHQIYQYDPEGEWKQLPDETSGIRVKRGNDTEKPAHEWNTLEVICVDGECLHLVNGEVVMAFRNPVRIVEGETIPLRAGKLQLQSEGAEVFYRNIELRLIDQIPASIEFPKPSL